ncbi:transcriptional regulator [Nocardia seriolae]|uniref:Transcriptional regulator n=1 Tax=Nocardia seriolae TaxID=37332 RepID=A0ABC9Z415_9NOCA|nr:transcriptional regulator [Nocardia seriolae]GEM26030.1 transcriptional regulator [Nocardia seriolae NBRC 15557]BEK87907.1 LCP family protein [Nocardia seriolae]BEK96607.1 LCP family protein [Nocardia seriolae]GAM50327.1 transcriptional regulator [Nocardia seriolae]
MVVAGRAAVGLVAVAVLVATGMGWRQYHHELNGLTIAGVSPEGPKSSGKTQNILIMGLDSRLDEHGNALPQDMYDALHAGDDSEGGFNANVLILVHIPGDGSKSTAISIPRDDYVTLDAGSCASSPCKGKIKQAYGFAYARAKDKLTAAGVKDAQELDQRSRDAGRLAESNTVSRFLGNVPVDHFFEVTLAAFFQIAQAVQPITVCLNEDTSDSYSGANFKKGKQQIDAAQAMAFVRQRRDPDQPLFTDLDRTRRQQAFIVSLLRQLQDSGTLSSPSKLRSLLDIAKQNTAIDKNLDPLAFVQRASALFDDGVSLFTLPVKDFGTDDAGESINIVDTDEIRTIVRNLLSPGDSEATPTTAPTPSATAIPGATGVVLNVVNSSGQNGLAAEVETALVTRGFTRGATSTGAPRDTTVLTYGAGAESAATALASRLGLTATKSTALDDQTVKLTLGTDARSGPIANLVADQPDPSTATSKTPKPTTSTTPPAPVSATASGTNAPAATDLSQMDTGGIPCLR